VLLIFTLDNSEKWDSIVRRFSNHDVYYLGSYVKAFQQHGDGEPHLFYFDNGNTRAINVVMKRDIADCEHFTGKIPTDTWYDLSTPYGYGGLLLDGYDIDELNEEYTAYCLDNNVVSEFVRFHPLAGNANFLSGLYDITELGKTVHIDLHDADAIWGNFSGKNRNAIRKARKLGVEIYWGRSPRLFSRFKAMYNQTMDAQNADSYYYFGDGFYYSILNYLKNNVMIFYATHEKNIIAMSIILMCNGQMHYHLSASNWDYRNYAATNLLLYEAALWGSANGFRTFHLGGGLGSREDSLYNFKKAFSRSSNNAFATGQKIFNKKMYDMLVDIRKGAQDFDEHSGFFPLYRS
jgi:hypothetical protein